MANRKAFTLIETLIVIIIISILASLSAILINGASSKARDLKRKTAISQIGRFLTIGCYVPDAGIGIYDLADLLSELKNKDERYRQALASQKWYDPKSGTETQSNYFYQVTEDKKCVVYANLENSSQAVDLIALSEVTPGGGSGTLASSSAGWNGSKIYYQYSN